MIKINWGGKKAFSNNLITTDPWIELWQREKTTTVKKQVSYSFILPLCLVFPTSYHIPQQ